MNSQGKVDFLKLRQALIFVATVYCPNHGGPDVLLLFTGLNAIMLFLLFLMIPSTERKTLEDMNQLFDQPTKSRVATNIRSVADILKLNDNKTPAPNVALPQMQTQDLQQPEGGPHRVAGNATP